MENNKDVLRYISCACFGVCTLLTFSQLIDYFRYSLNQMIFIGNMYVMKFRLYTICFLAGIVLLGLVIDSFPSTESVPFGASRQYGASAPNMRYRRYDASAPGGGPGP